MPYSSRKRPRSDSVNKSSSQEPIKKQKQIVVEKGDCTIRGQISVELCGGLSVFPLQLRKFVEGLHIKKTMQHMNAILHEDTPYIEISFSIIAGHRERPSSQDYTYNSVAENIPTASIANIKLLRYALSTLPIDPEFLELSDVGDLVARETLFLHSVRLGEVGWAIDRCECVSLYIISRDGAKLKETVFFVEEKAQEDKRENPDHDSHTRQQVAGQVGAYEVNCDEFEDYVDRDGSDGDDTDQLEDSGDGGMSEELNERVDIGKAMIENRPIPSISHTPPISPQATVRYSLRSTSRIRERKWHMFNHPRGILPHLTEVEEATYDAVMLKITLPNLPSNFPARLTNTLECSYKSAFLAHMSSLYYKRQPKTGSKEVFSIISVRITATMYNTRVTHETGFTSVILANHELLKWYCRSTSEQSLEIENFIEIAIEDGDENPQLNQMRSVGNLDLGWGFDTHGCLSLYRCQNEGRKTVHHVVYVKRDIPQNWSDHEVVVLD